MMNESLDIPQPISKRKKRRWVYVFLRDQSLALMQKLGVVLRLSPAAQTADSLYPHSTSPHYSAIEKLKNKWLKHRIFFREFLRAPFCTGTFMGSSKISARFICDRINFLQARCVLELGAGLGAFTNEILLRLSPHTHFLAFEINPHFHRALQHAVAQKKWLTHDHIHILSASATEIDHHVATLAHTDHVDFVVSGLPFLSLPGQLSHEILSKTQKLLGGDGKLFAIAYTRESDALFRNYFANVRVHYQFFNMPPTFIYECSNSPAV